MKCSKRDGEECASDDSLKLYFRDIAPLGVLSAEAELAATHEIAAKRRACWVSILSYHPLLEAVIELVETRGDGDKLPRAELDATRTASRRCGGGGSSMAVDEAAVNEAAMALAECIASAGPQRA